MSSVCRSCLQGERGGLRENYYHSVWHEPPHSFSRFLRQITITLRIVKLRRKVDCGGYVRIQKARAFSRFWTIRFFKYLFIVFYIFFLCYQTNQYFQKPCSTQWLKKLKLRRHLTYFSSQYSTMLGILPPPRPPFPFQTAVYYVYTYERAEVEG